ncbi:unnamed protein product, partial [marine sediment metagenome]
LATAPVFLDQAGTASIDLAFAALTAAALACLVAWFDEGKPAWLALAAFLAGSSCGIRHTGYLVCLLLGLAVLCGKNPNRVRTTAGFAGLALAAALPWLVRSAVVAGNPVYPFLESVFSPGRLPDASITAFAAHPSIKGTGWKDLLRFPWDIIMRPGLYDGWTKSPGGLVLLLGIPGLVVGGKRSRWLGGFSVAGGVSFFYFQRLARYLLPFFVPMMVVAGVAACRLKGLRRSVSVLLLV